MYEKRNVSDRRLDFDDEVDRTELYLIVKGWRKLLPILKYKVSSILRPHYSTALYT